MFKKMFWVLLLFATVAATGCNGRGAISGQADYYGEYPYRRPVPYDYYDPFYDPFLYPGYIYEPYPSYYFGGLFIYGYPYYPHYFYPYHRRFVGPGDRSLRGFRGGSSGPPTARRPSPDRSLR